MTSPQPTSTNLDSIESKKQQIRDVAMEEYGHLSPFLNPMLDDVTDLYAGRWQTHEACQVGYHTFDHALDVTLATARMIAGWRREHRTTVPEDVFLAGVAAGIFHDTGYMKEKGDTVGTGGKFTFTHVPRSMVLAEKYLTAHHWPEHLVHLIPVIIGLTEFSKPPEIDGKFDDQTVETVGRMVATADLVAQMSDVKYMEHIHDLYEEFHEAYVSEGVENLKKRGVFMFQSAQQLIDGTPGFYQNFVLPRLAQLGGMSRYLISYFGEGRNPYLESIAANLSGDAVGQKLKWRRIGEVLQELGAVTNTQIEQALSLQKKSREKNETNTTRLREVKHRAQTWVERQLAGECLGDILMKSANLSAASLRQGVIAQLLPTDFTMRLNSKELLHLLHAMILLQNISNGPWIIEQIMEIIVELLDCSRCSILLADTEAGHLKIAFATGPDREDCLGKTGPIDKGLAGWVYLQGKPSILDNSKMTEPAEATGNQEGRNSSALAVPVTIAGQTIGVFEALDKKSGLFTDHDMNLLSLVGNLLSNSLAATLWLQY